ncbi:PAS domain S-box protein [Archaeoglobus neptunius]|uniref:PAS domain S-box protein n=1 Tax=Archaeoglobus neptunius TaxID=2798580 RepID=UPI001925896E|nr:PAS domain S-box protein [Archaeoglobus neptunius]
MDIKIDALPDPVIVTDYRGRILALNTYARDLGFSTGSIISIEEGECEINGKIYHVKVSRLNSHIIYVLRDVTHSKERERELKEKEKTYRTLVDLSPYGIIVHDGQRLLFANKKAAEVAGFASPEEMIGYPVLKFIHPDYLDFVRSRISKMMSEGTAAPTAVEKFILPDGRVIDVEVAASYITFNGRPAILLVINDISERKKMERDLVESESRYRDFFENSLDMIVVTDLKGNFMEVNKEFENRSGYSREEVLGRNFSEFFSSVDAKQIFEVYNRAFRNRKNVYGLEFSFKTKYGETKIVEASVRPLTKGSKVVGFVSNFRDITDRKRLEEELKRTNRLLKIINRINELIVREKDVKNLMNRIAEEIAKYNRYSWIGLTREGKIEIEGISGIKKEEVEKELEEGMMCVQEALKSKKPVIMHCGEHPENCPNFERHFNLNCYIFPVKHENRISGVVAICSEERMGDEEVQLIQTLSDDIAFAINTAELEKIREKSLKQIEKNIEQFAILVDKIRNPLAIISGAAELWDVKEKDKILAAVKKIEEIIEMLEKGWLESEDVKNLLRRLENEKNPAGRR